MLAVFSNISFLVKGGDNELSDLKALYGRQAEVRKALLETFVNDTKYGLLYNILVPEVRIFKNFFPFFQVFCPGLARIGSVGDGGKWVCNPFAKLQAPCSVYSLGVNNDISFDVEVQTLTNKKCKIYAYDMVRIKNRYSAFDKSK